MPQYPGANGFQTEVPQVGSPSGITGTQSIVQSIIADPIALAALVAAIAQPVFAALPVYVGTGPAPVPTGQFFLNGLIPEQAQ